MTKKECQNCIFAVDGICRLEHTHGLTQPECPYKEGTASTLSVS